MNDYSNSQDKLKKEVDDKTSEEEINKFVKDLCRIKDSLYLNFQKIIYFDEPLYTFIVLIETYIFLKISKYINDKLIVLILGNIIIFYSVIEKKYPKFLFRSRMFIKEIIEGVLSAIMALIPKYEEVTKDQ